MDLKHKRRRTGHSSKSSFILTGACDRGLHCGCGPEGEAAGFGACGRCLFHVGCAADPTQLCESCHVLLGALDFSRFQSCFMDGCSTKAGGLCRKCSTTVGSALKRQITNLESMTAANLRKSIAQYPGLQSLPAVLHTKVFEAILAHLRLDWHFRVDRSLNVTAFGKILLEEHKRDPRPILLSELVYRAGFGAVESHAVTQLRREIHRRPNQWTLVGTTVHLSGVAGGVTSSESLLKYVQSKNEAVPATAILGMYAGAASDLCKLIGDGLLGRAQGSIFPTWPGGAAGSVPAEKRLELWLDAASI